MSAGYFYGEINRGYSKVSGRLKTGERGKLYGWSDGISHLYFGRFRWLLADC